MNILKQVMSKHSVVFLNLLWFAFTINLTACSFFLGDKKPGDLSADTDQSDASFIVDELKESKVVATRINGLPEEFEISYKACFRDFIHNDQPLSLNVFNIHFFEDVPALTKAKNTNGSVECSETSHFNFSEDHSKVHCLRMRTEADGCLQWTEIYPYKMINKSVWFRYERAFEGTGVNKGTVVVPLAINPRLSVDRSGAASPLQVMDLRHYSKFRQQAFRLKQKDIVECNTCNDKKGNTLHCNICQQKQRSLSAVIDHFSKQTGFPRLWIDGAVGSYVNQEPILLTKPSLNHLKVLKQFKVCHSDITDNCDPSGRFFKIHLELPLRIRVKNHRNEIELLPLNRGDYSVKPYLFLVDDKGKHLSLHRDVDFIPAKLVPGSENNNLRVDFYLHVPYEHYGFQVFLGLKVKPEGNMTFLPFEGVLNFPGKLRTVMGSNTLPLNHDVIAFYEDNSDTQASFINTTYQLSGDPNMNRDREGFRRAGWNLELRRLRFSDVNLEEGKCSTPVDRHIRYVGEVCIVDPLTGDVVSDTNISIKRQDIVRDDRSSEFLDSQVVEIEKAKLSSSDYMSQYQLGTREYLPGQSKDNHSSDTSGCIRWVDQIYHKWYNRQKYFVRKMIFSKKEWGFEGEKMIAINPWHWGFLFFQDISQIGTDAIRTSTDQVEKPRIFLHDFRSQFVEMIYTIDKWLGVNTFQNLLFLFRVMVDRPDDVGVGLGGRGPSAKPARRGYYRARFILVKAHTEEAGGRGNMVVNDDVYQELYENSRDQSWNTNMGWRLGRDNGRLVGQMMNTNLEYITHFDTSVQIRDGMLNAYINFRFNLDEFIFIGSNSRLIVQILPTEPKNYQYKTGAGCEIDPDRSIFTPYEGNHDLISQAFMGSFVASDQRNWNIFRVLDIIPFQLSGSDSSDEIYKMNVSKEQLARFIENGKKDSVEHKLFTVLHSTMNAEAIQISDTAKQAITESSQHFEDVYQRLKAFLTAYNEEGDTDQESDKQVLENRRNGLIESIHGSISSVNKILNGSDNNHSISDFSRQVLRVFTDVLEVFEDNNNSPVVLKDTAQETLNKYMKIIKEYLPHLSEEEKNTLLSLENSQNKWFEPGTNIPDNRAELSTFNMNRFAQSEGLKVLSFDEGDGLNRFIDDLKNIANIHNTYREEYLTPKKSPIGELWDEWVGGTLDQWFGDEDEGENEEEELNAYDNIDAEENIDFRLAEHSPPSDPQGLINLAQEHTQVLHDNFPLLKNDHYFTFKEKIRRMHLPEMSPQWLRTVIEQGIHAGTLDTPEVMTFLHSMCGFWFNDFYEKYLEQYQLDAIYTDHLNHFQYYKGTLNYFLEEYGPKQQYKDLFQAMQQYSLFDMEKNEGPLRVENPFMLQGLEQLFPVSTSDNVMDSLYEEIPYIDETYRILSRAEALSAENRWYHVITGNDNINKIMAKNRHPYFKCLSNPLDFFHIEKKIIVGDIGSDYSDLIYEYGQTRAFNAQTAFDYSYAASWGMARGFSSSLGAGFTALGGLLNPFKYVSPVLAFSGVKFSSEWSTGISDSESNRRQMSVRYATALYLVLNHSVISMALKNYRQCLVIRAHNLAFDGYDAHVIWNERLANNFIHQIPYIKSGLLICTEDIDAEKDQKPMRIAEDYFYMYQPNQGDRGQFLNPLNFRNRPYVITIRGITEWQKIEFLIHSFVEADGEPGVEDYNPKGPMTNPTDRQSNVADGTRRAIRQAKVWDKTGFYPGVYNVKYDEEHFYFKTEIRDRGEVEKLAKKLYDINPLGFIHIDDTQSVIGNPAPQ